MRHWDFFDFWERKHETEKSHSSLELSLLLFRNETAHFETQGTFIFEYSPDKNKHFHTSEGKAQYDILSEWFGVCK